MSEEKLKELPLENGLMLCVVDCSRPISADAFLVKLRFEVEVVLTEALAASLGKTLFEVKDILKNEALTFTAEVERNFISAADAEGVKEGLVSSYIETNRSYLGHEKFATGFLRREMAKAP